MEILCQNVDQNALETPTATPINIAEKTDVETLALTLAEREPTVTSEITEPSAPAQSISQVIPIPDVTQNVPNMTTVPITKLATCSSVLIHAKELVELEPTARSRSTHLFALAQEDILGTHLFLAEPSH